MTPDINELVKRSRDTYWSGAPYMRELLDKSADALEAMASEVERVTKERDVAWIERKNWMTGFDEQEARAEAAESERDRLKAELKTALQLLHDNAVRESRLKDALVEAVAMLRTIYEDDYLQSKFSKALGGDA